MESENASNEFRTLLAFLKVMHHRLIRAQRAFFVYEGMCEVTAPNRAGKVSASENARLLNAYGNFYMPAKEATRIYFFIELAKLFDASDQSLHIHKVLNYTESNIRSLTAKAFLEHNSHQGRVFLDQLAKEYRGIEHKELKSLRQRLAKKKTSIHRLKDYRDKWLVHEDIKRDLKPPNITGRDIRSLFSLLEEILNLLSGRLNSETWSYTRLEKESKGHVKLFVRHLRRFEPYRLKEIDKRIERMAKRYRSKKA